MPVDTFAPQLPQTQAGQQYTVQIPLSSAPPAGTYEMTVAKFPAYRDLDSFDFTQSTVNETLVREWYAARYLEGARNLVFVGGPGTGKTHLATALAISAIKRMPLTRLTPRFQWPPIWEPAIHPNRKTAIAASTP